MYECGQVTQLRPADCSAAVNVAIGMLAEQLNCGVDAAFRVLQVEAGEDPAGLERLSWLMLVQHAVRVGTSVVPPPGSRQGRRHPGLREAARYLTASAFAAPEPYMPMIATGRDTGSSDP